MVEGIAKVINPTGLHAVPASQLTHFTNQFKCKIHFVQNGMSSNAKSILNILALGIEQGMNVTVRVDGPNKKRVLRDVIHYIETLED